MFQTNATWNYKIERRSLKPVSLLYTKQVLFQISLASLDDLPQDCSEMTLYRNEKVCCCCYFPWVKMSLRWSISATRAMVTSSRTKLTNMSFYNSYPITISGYLRAFTQYQPGSSQSLKGKQPWPIKCCLCDYKAKEIQNRGIISWNS